MRTIINSACSRNILWVLSALSILAFTCHPAHAENNIDNARKRIALLSKNIQEDHIVRLEIFFIPGTTETLIDTTPAALRQHYKYKLELRCFMSSASLYQLHKVVSKMRLSAPVNGYRNFRWGLIAYSSDPTEKWEIDMGRWGKNAEIDGFLVGLNGDLYKWLIQNTKAINAGTF